MSDVNDDLKKTEDEELDLENQDQEDEELQDEDQHQEDEQVEEQDEDDGSNEEDDSEEEEEAPKPSRREELRIQKLLQKMKEDGSSPEKRQPTPKQNVFEDDDESDQPDYRQEIDSVYRFSRFETRLEVDAPKVEAKHPQLDKSSDQFNPVLADTVNRMYLSFVGFDPKNRSVRTDEVRYADYVDSVWELASEIAGESTERTELNIRKQASKTGLRPGGGAAKRLNLNKAPSQMTDEELDAIIAQGIPPKK